MQSFRAQLLCLFKFVVTLHMTYWAIYATTLKFWKIYFWGRDDFFHTHLICTIEAFSSHSVLSMYSKIHELGSMEPQTFLQVLCSNVWTACDKSQDKPLQWRSIYSTGEYIKLLMRNFFREGYVFTNRKKFRWKTNVITMLQCLLKVRSSLCHRGSLLSVGISFSFYWTSIDTNNIIFLITFLYSTKYYPSDRSASLS